MDSNNKTAQSNFGIGRVATPGGRPIRSCHEQLLNRIC